MKAMVLASGLGTRLRPLTEAMPKCLMPLGGRPLIDWTLRWLHSFGVTECMINLHYLPDKVRNFVGNGDLYGLQVYYSYEPELLGTAGAVKKAGSFFDQPFYVIYADNFSQWDIRKLKVAHNQHHPIATMAVHWCEDVTKSGMVKIDRNNIMLGLVEKPKPEQVNSNYVSAGFFCLDPKVLTYIPDNTFYDFGFHVFPEMLSAGEKIYVVRMEDPIIGIDTKESYEKANEWALKLLMDDQKRRI